MEVDVDVDRRRSSFMPSFDNLRRTNSRIFIAAVMSRLNLVLSIPLLSAGIMLLRIAGEESRRTQPEVPTYKPVQYRLFQVVGVACFLLALGWLFHR
jgi:hypothetical protein